MCFELPSKIISIKEGKAVVDCNGHQHKVSLELIDNVKIGNYVMVQGGYVISKVEEKEVKELLDLLKDRNKRRENKK